ncbi:MAG: DUF1566 domain-containing protein [Gammaproteobacteria bacterium]|nr:DUF1566 domain-containing protein [Gammaproteobacteria bacterium]
MPSAHFLSKTFRTSLFLLLSVVVLSGCDFRSTPSCYVAFQDRPDLLSGFSLAQNGLANKAGSSLFWSRCPAGMQYSDPQTCSGIPVLLSFDQAQTYALDMSDKSGQTIRLPTRREMGSLTENSCNNPSLNTNVFPVASSENFWTSEEDAFRSNLACTFYTFQGQSSCLELKTTEYPFMLVIERDSF